MLKLNEASVRKVVKDRLAPLFEIDNGTLDVVAVCDSTRSIRLRFGGSYFGAPCRQILVEYVIEPTLREIFKDIQKIDWVE